MDRLHRPPSPLFVGVFAALILLAGGCAATAGTPSAEPPVTEGEPVIYQQPSRPGMETLSFTSGPLSVVPGQNSIEFTGDDVPRPKVDGYIVGMRPNVVYEDGAVPPTDVLHLHHGVWVNMGRQDTTSPSLPERFFFAGEEKTAAQIPEGYGYPIKTSEAWVINYMLHNLIAKPAKVSITYEIDFIPNTADAAKSIIPVRPIWMDVQNGDLTNGGLYPVFDVIKGEGHDGTYTYPTDAVNPYPAGVAKNEWTVDRDGVVVSAMGHLHPGGLTTDLSIARGGKTAEMFTADTHYYEPAGAVSWDVALTVTPPEYRAAVKRGDTLSISTTYDSSRASWYESMGLMIAWMADTPTGTDPFVENVNSGGVLTHGHLPENDNHGGEPTEEFVDLTAYPSGTAPDGVTIADFTYAPGDMSGLFDSIPTVKPGQPLKFNNVDPAGTRGIWHTITACKPPCNGATGVAYPLADAEIEFDSGQLGVAGIPTADRLNWSTPETLPEGTYTYFCRIHPIMRGAFRVEE